MKKIFSSIILLTIINGCNGTTPKPESKKIVDNTKEVKSPKVEVKKEDPFEVAKQSCLAKNAQGCIDFGWIMVEQEDYDLAKTAFNLSYDYGDKDGGMRGSYYVECLEKNAKSCGMLGYYLEEGKGGSQDYKFARLAYQQAIDLEDTSSLGSLAHLYSKGLGGERSQFKATKLFEKSCNLSSEKLKYENCFNAGNKYADGKGVRQDNFKAVKFYQKACIGGYAESCNSLGWMYKYGKGVRQSNSTAQMYYGKGCDLGSDLACENYAKNNR